jgi:hypothetical protein
MVLSEYKVAAGLAIQPHSLSAKVLYGPASSWPYSPLNCREVAFSRQLANRGNPPPIFGTPIATVR